ncbi:MAG TPA: hypothetical protein VHW66_09890 [Stellaceae bacterium]|jgi:hypothetical protein|nr:hypothetical protein [Stellaceae bacterium]
MLYFVIGLPGHFSAWCDAVALRLVERAHGPAAMLSADTLPELAATAIYAGTAHAVVRSRFPGGRLRAALTEAERRYLVALDDPRLALIDLGDAESPDIAAATPAVATSCAAIAGYDRSPGSLVVRSAEAAADPAAAARRIAEHFELGIDDETVGNIVAVLAEEGVAAGAPEAATRWHALDPNSRGWAEGALASYINYFDTGSLTPINWARELFFLGDRPDERASWIIDITGRARCLLQGPAIMVAAGTWLMTVRLLFSREATEHEFQVELHSDHLLGEATVRPEREGGLEVNFPLTLDESANHPLTIRVSNRRAAFDGACAMDNVVLTPQG